MSLALEFNDGCNARWQEAVDAFKEHAKSVSPNEACGLILADGSLRVAENIHPDPINEFIIDPEAWVDADVVAVLHSHTPTYRDGELLLPYHGVTKADLNEQIKTGLPWGIVLCNHEFAEQPFWFGDEVPTAPLLGRTFIHGKWDCYSLIRDWHKEEHGIVLHNEGRDMDWWLNKDLDRFYDQFEAHGFRKVDRSMDPMPGDVFITKVHSSVMNHAGVYIGNDLILHHLNFQLSVRTPAFRWRQKLDFLVRHKDLPEIADVPA